MTALPKASESTLSLPLVSFLSRQSERSQIAVAGDREPGRPLTPVYACGGRHPPPVCAAHSVALETSPQVDLVFQPGIHLDRPAWRWGRLLASVAASGRRTLDDSASVAQSEVSLRFRVLGQPLTAPAQPFPAFLRPLLTGPLVLIFPLVAFLWSDLHGLIRALEASSGFPRRSPSRSFHRHAPRRTRNSGISPCPLADVARGM